MAREVLTRRSAVQRRPVGRPVPSARRTESQGQGRPARRRLPLLAAGLALVLAVTTAGILLTIHTASATTDGVISVLLQEDQQSGSVSPATRDAIAAAAETMSARGGGTLILHQGAGSTPVRVATVSLAVQRDGRPESDPTLRAAAINSRLTAVFAKAAGTSIHGSGRSLAEFLAAAADDEVGHRGAHDVWVRSFGLSTMDPVDTRILMNADPKEAVASLPTSAFPLLNGARIHWIFPSAGGDQPSLNLRTEKWRLAFLRAYIARSGGTLVSTAQEEGTRRATNEPTAPVVPNLPDPTPRPPKVSHGVLTTSIDTSSLFVPDRAVLIDPGLARAQLQPLADAWASGAYSSIVCTGRIADFDPPGSSVGLRLSLARAQQITTILAGMDVPATPVGVGSSEPLPGDPRSAIQRSVTCVATPVAAVNE